MQWVTKGTSATADKTMELCLEEARPEGLVILI